MEKFDCSKGSDQAYDIGAEDDVWYERDRWSTPNRILLP
jgi:hypothetical protein